MTRPQTPRRVEPATARVHLEFNAGEDIDHDLTVTERGGEPVPLTSAVATIALLDGTVVHEWTSAAGNLSLPGPTGVVRLHTTAEQTRAWAEAWDDAEWQLDTVDVFGGRKRPCEGQVRVLPTRRNP